MLSKTRKPKSYPERDLVHLPLMRKCRQHPILGTNVKYLFHVENERKTYSLSAGTMRKAMGVKGGIADLLLLYPSRGYPFLCLELKAPGGTLSEAQEAFMAQMQAVGAYTAVFDDAEKAYRMLLWYLDETP